MNRLFIIFFILFISGISGAQELNCRVTINADQVQTSDRRIFEDMAEAFEQFLNNNQWSKDDFEGYERINCNMIVTLQNTPTLGYFEGTVQIQTARPVYNSNYESILFNYADRNWQFEYIESQPLQFNDNTYTTNLTSLLAFYAYLMLGLDYDSFGNLAGTPYLQLAQTVVNNAQTSNRPGWDALGSTRNRYWLIENLTNQQMIGIREGIYTYHRLALDQFEKDPAKSRELIIEVLEKLQMVKKTYPNSILVISFLDAKSDELVKIFTDGDLNSKRKAFELLSSLDPSKRSTFEKILN
jgi:hypothetical protein